MTDEMFEGQWAWGPWQRQFRGIGMRAQRGIMPRIILQVLREGPKHGYDIIRHIEETSHGFWRPSAGSVYPTLQLLEEQDLVRSTEHGGKRIYELTEQGKEQAKKNGNVWQHHGESFQQEHGAAMKRMRLLRTLAKDAVSHVRSIVRNGSDEDIAAAETIVTKAVEELAVLAAKRS